MRAGDSTSPIQSFHSLLQYIDNSNLFQIQLSLAIIHQLENEPFIAQLREVCNPDFAQYLGEIDPKNVTRYMNLAKLANYITQETGLGQEFKGFEYWRKKLLYLGLASRQVEQGGGWTGFGGVHSHYTFTDLGARFFQVQALLLVTPPIGEDLITQVPSIDSRVLTYRITQELFINRKTVNPNAPLTGNLSKPLQDLLITILGGLGIILNAKKKVTVKMLRSYLSENYGEEVSDDNITTCLIRLQNFVRGSGDLKITLEGQAVFHCIGEMLHMQPDS